MPIKQLGCPPQLLGPLAQEQFQQQDPTAYAVGGRLYREDCGCPPGMRPASGNLCHPSKCTLCFPSECTVCPDDENMPPLPGWQYVGYKPAWIPQNLHPISTICCPYASDYDAPPQPPSERCPPGYHWEDTERGWVCIPDKKSLPQATVQTILAGGMAPGTTKRQRRAIRRAYLGG